MIRMIGTDHTLATVNERSVFTLKKSEMPGIMAALKTACQADGIIILSTCNRLEIWLDTENEDINIFRQFCSAIGVDPDKYPNVFTAREGNEAIRHLFYLACGLKSAILAEDQILTQVKQALSFARLNEMASGRLEVLFRTAISAAKKVKTEVAFSRADTTAIGQAIRMLENNGFCLKDKTCMVIGNGEYGRLAAEALKKAGADVIVTVRQYHSGLVLIPDGCRTILYGDKMEWFPSCDLIVSATSSPNYTLYYDKVSLCPAPNEKILIDFAVPRDIDPRIAELPGYRLYDIDDFHTEMTDQNKTAMLLAESILEEYMADYNGWLQRRQKRFENEKKYQVFPAFIRTDGKKVLVVGGGTIATRRVQSLISFSWTILVVSPTATATIQSLSHAGSIELITRGFSESDLDNIDIVLACTDSSELNSHIVSLCHDRGITVNNCSDQRECDFYFPGLVTGEDFIIGVTANGKNHKRAKYIRKKIEEVLDNE